LVGLHLSREIFGTVATLFGPEIQTVALLSFGGSLDRESDLVRETASHIGNDPTNHGDLPSSALLSLEAFVHPSASPGDQYPTGKPMIDRPPANPDSEFPLLSGDDKPQGQSRVVAANFDTRVFEMFPPLSPVEAKSKRAIEELPPGRQHWNPLADPPPAHPQEAALRKGSAPTSDPFAAAIPPSSSSCEDFSSSASSDPFAAPRSGDPLAAPAPVDPFAATTASDPFAAVTTIDPFAGPKSVAPPEWEAFAPS
jgi:hypothetical protein